MAYVREHRDVRTTPGTGTATGVVVGLFLALALGLALLAFVAALGLRDVTEVSTQDVAMAVSLLLVSALPFLAAPILAVVGGALAGVVTRDAGQGALGGGLGAVLGVLVLFIVIGLGFLLGAAAAGVAVNQVTFPEGTIPPGLQGTLGFLATVGGVMYLLVHAIVGAIAGAVTGSVYARYERTVVTREAPAV